MRTRAIALLEHLTLLRAPLGSEEIRLVNQSRDARKVLTKLGGFGNLRLISLGR